MRAIGSSCGLRNIKRFKEVGYKMDTSFLTLHWATWDEFFAMGGYALFVWGSFGACVLLLLMESLQARGAWGKELEDLRQAYELDADLAQRRGGRA